MSSELRAVEFPQSPDSMLDGNDLLRRINEVVASWSTTQRVVIHHEGALVTIKERFDVYAGYEILIQYPFVVSP